MILCCAAFSEQGRRKAEETLNRLPAFDCIYREEGEPLSVFAQRAFHYHLPLLFVGAAGIAVRTIAPFVRDKLTDSPVLVMDEAGRFVIPILSGHAGGANDLAAYLADAASAQPVITTATDVEESFSCDVFARRNYLKIQNRDGIRMISAKLLREGRISIRIQEGIRLPDEPMPPCITMTKDAPDILISDAQTVPCSLWLSPGRVWLGIGCRRGKSFEELHAFACRILDQNGIRQGEVAGIASIDLKRHEQGLQILAQYEHLPFRTFSAEQLAAAEGTFSASDFVQKTTGVSNVCERAAVLAAGAGAELIFPKTAQDGMTIAAARGRAQIRTWQTQPGMGEIDI